MKIKQFNLLDKKMNTIIEQTKSKYDDINITLYEWANQWITNYKRGVVKDTTTHKYICMIQRLPSRLTTKFIGEIKQIDINQFIISFGDKSRQKQHFYTMLNDMFERAVENELIENNPMKKIKMPKHSKVRHNAMTRDDEKIFVENCLKDKHGLMFIIMLYAGLRKGEVCALNYSDIDVVNRKIHITKALNDLNKIDTPKSKTSIRVVPIFDELMPYVEKLKNNMSNKRIFPVSDSVVYKHYFRILENSGFKKGYYTTHSMRHTFATRCAERGINVKTAQKWLGHSTSSLTSDICKRQKLTP